MKMEEKLQQAAINHSRRSQFLSNFPHDFNSELYGFIAGAKSPESLEYWKEKEKLYSENEVYSLLLKFQISFSKYKVVQITPMDIKEFFEQNKKK